MTAAPEQKQTEPASIGDFTQYLGGYIQDLRRGTPEARPTKFERDESGKLLIPEGADPHRYQELQRAQEGPSVGRDPETGEPLRVPEWAGIKTEGFERMSDEQEAKPEPVRVNSRNPTDPAVREGFYAALRKRFPDRAPTPEEQAQVAAEYLAGNESTARVSPQLINELLNTDESGKMKPKKKQIGKRILDIASRGEMML